VRQLRSAFIDASPGQASRVSRLLAGERAPTMVVTKIASRLHACAVSSAGHGMANLMSRPMAMAMAALLNSIGCKHRR
jgi:hypothetical protein